ncbi:HAD family hydrolase [Fibrella aquatica]|uniref:HAD family hydrolase n=1 Tax=Fibrella aquatica TaxID=3242487 RepID=UPI00351FF867
MNSSSRFIDQFDVILLDLMDTLMFGGNRFSEEQDYAQTYRKLGGTYHSNNEVQWVIRQVYETMSEHYADPAYHENFKPASTYLAETLDALGLPQTDAPRLHNVFAHHELGHVPDRHCEALHQLAKTHRLGLVSNLWSEKALFVRVFRQCRIHHLFDTLVFSSDHSLVKPSPKIFQKALAHFDHPPHRILFIGDSPDRDMAGAEALGLGTLLVTGGRETTYPGRTLTDICDLLAYHC